MHQAQMADRPRLEMRWVSVTDERGRTRMQATWVDAAAVRETPHHAA